MNRPRNRQPRPRNHQDSRPPRSAPRGGTINVPTIHQVTPGASVSIVLKVDQATGREVRGVVQDLLTHGNHPRGIKVRLQGGLVGRVQRMADGMASTSRTSADDHESAAANAGPRRAREDDESHQEGLPARSLPDFLPEEFDSDIAEPLPGRRNVNFKTATVKCPICGTFEGDEAAVAHHVEDHLT